MASLLAFGPFTVTPFSLIVFLGALCGILLSLRKKEYIIKYYAVYINIFNLSVSYSIYFLRVYY